MQVDLAAQVQQRRVAHVEDDGSPAGARLDGREVVGSGHGPIVALQDPCAHDGPHGVPGRGPVTSRSGATGPGRTSTPGADGGDGSTGVDGVKPTHP
ncbi:hypothetical protein GCM10009756_04400 [Pseudokineococcus marinus]